MSWAAMNYVFRLRKDTGIVGNLRFVLLCIAKWIPKRQGCMETLELPLGVLVRMTGLDRKTVGRLRDQLVKRGEVVIGKPGRGRGNFQTYIMPKLAGPLFSEVGGKGGTVPHEKGGTVPCLPGEKVASRPESVRTASEELSTKDRTTTTDGKAVAAAIYTEALAFIDWCAAVYPEHNHGANLAFDIERAGPIVVELLTKPRRSLERLRAMALVMWTCSPQEDPWVSRATERGFELLRHAANRLDRIAGQRAVASEPPVRVQTRADGLELCPHEPKCLHDLLCAQRQEREAGRAAAR